MCITDRLCVYYWWYLYHILGTAALDNYYYQGIQPRVKDARQKPSFSGGGKS